LDSENDVKDIRNDKEDGGRYQDEIRRLKLNRKVTGLREWLGKLER